MNHFQQFFKTYPRPEGFGAARKSWSNQIFFHAASEDQMLDACIQYRKKTIDTETKFIPKPSKWLDDQYYLDFQMSIPEEKETSAHIEMLCKSINRQTVLMNCTGSELVDGILYLRKTGVICDLFKNNNETYLRMCGIVDVKPISEIGRGSDSPL